MLNFKSFIESVDFNKTKNIKKGLKKYKPGTFGVEIEFIVEDSSNDELVLMLQNDRKVYKDFLDQLPKSPDDLSEEDYNKFYNAFINSITPEIAADKYGLEGYENRSSINPLHDKIDEYISFLSSIGAKSVYGDATNDAFGIGPDSGYLEIRTPILTTKDFPIFKKLLDKLQEEKFSGDNSAHVHIGMPENTNGFDLIAMTTLADEKQVKIDAGDGRNFDDWARLRSANHQKLSSAIEKLIEPELETIVDDEDVKHIAFNSSKFLGTNLKSFGRLGTVEFRYLSSQIVKNSNKLLEWIQYYLILPNIAQSRKQIKIQGHLNDYYILTRMPGNKIKITKNQKATQPQQSPFDLRQFNMQPDLIERKFLRQYGNQKVDGVMWALFAIAEYSIAKKITHHFKLNDFQDFKQFTVNQLWEILNRRERDMLLNRVKNLK